jgi:hypothetical protein
MGKKARVTMELKVKYLGYEPADFSKAFRNCWKWNIGAQY